MRDIFTATVVVRQVEGTGTKQEDKEISACLEEDCKMYLANKSDNNSHVLDSESAMLWKNLEQGKSIRIILAHKFCLKPCKISTVSNTHYNPTKGNRC